MCISGEVNDELSRTDIDNPLGRESYALMMLINVLVPLLEHGLRPEWKQILPSASLMESSIWAKNMTYYTQHTLPSTILALLVRSLAAACTVSYFYHVFIDRNMTCYSMTSKYWNVFRHLEPCSFVIQCLIVLSNTPHDRYIFKQERFLALMYGETQNSIVSIRHVTSCTRTRNFRRNLWMKHRILFKTTCL